MSAHDVAFWTGAAMVGFHYGGLLGAGTALMVTSVAAAALIVFGEKP